MARNDRCGADSYSDIAKLPKAEPRRKSRKTEHCKPSVRAKEEHSFRDIKRQFASGEGEIPQVANGLTRCNWERKPICETKTHVCSQFRIPT